MYPWLVYFHILALFGFLLAHGASMSVSFALRREQNLERIRALLELSGSSFGVMYISMLVLLLSGVAAGLIGHWWGKIWIWAALVLLLVIVGAMAGLGSSIYGAARKAAGLQYFEGMKQHPPIEPASESEIRATLARGNPILLTVIGYGGLAIIVWLMRFKPF
jgi:hypothetical protein